jgi:hypothetical protein
MLLRAGVPLFLRGPEELFGHRPSWGIDAIEWAANNIDVSLQMVSPNLVNKGIPGR